jgi:predicted CXXCH cytochrome family protein
MKGTTATLLITVVAGSLLNPGTAQNAPAVTFLHPVSDTVIGGAGLIHLVLRMNRPAEISARVNGIPVVESHVEGQIRHYPVQLSSGLNQIIVEVKGQGKVLETEKRRVFFFSPIGDDKRIPQDISSKPFHRAGEDHEECTPCHVLEPQQADYRPRTGSDSSCNDCHRGLLEFKQVHGPAFLWNCLVCHDSESTPVLYSTPRPVRDLCFQCHTTLRDYFFSAPYQHGPTATGMCTICHNPHASDNEYWLKKEPWDLCTTCHFEKASGRHVIAWGPGGDTHPTRFRPDPMRPEREFSCRSCHNPHASDAPKLWNFKVSSYYQLCWTCHQK